MLYDFVSIVARRPTSCEPLCNCWNYSIENSYVLTAAVLNVFRLTDHLVNFALVRGPPRLSRAKAGPGQNSFQFIPQKSQSFQFTRTISERPF